jgi:phosphoglucomutase
MKPHHLAGKIAPRNMLINVPKLVSAYYRNHPDNGEQSQKVSFGTSGHRGSSLENSFNEPHILAISQAIGEFRRNHAIDGPLYLGMDTHALSEPAFATAVEVFAGNDVILKLQQGGGFTPTPVISHAILSYNNGRRSGLADGVVITPSHNPPQDGGFKYNPPSGGPADTDTTRWIQNRANEIMKNGTASVRRIPFERAMKASTTHSHDYVMPYVLDLAQVIDFEAISSAGLRIGVDPMGGAGIDFWEPVADIYRLNIDIVNRDVDPTFSFMPLDWDGRIRMDCSSAYAMAELVKLKDRYDIAFGNDTDYDRHGIVTPGTGLMNPNHYLAASIFYLFQNRPEWKVDAAIGKTLVSSAMIDRVAARLGRPLAEVPVGFKWFVAGLLDGSFGFGGEESAGASFLRRDGTVWTTDKDGFIMDLLAAEITARTGRDPGQQYHELEKQFGSPAYARIDAPASPEQKEALLSLDVETIRERELGGEKIIALLNRAPFNNAPIGGIKIVARNGWFAARPSGTENVYKIYAESFLGQDHLKRIQEEAQEIVNHSFRFVRKDL